MPEIREIIEENSKKISQATKIPKKEIITLLCRDLGVDFNWIFLNDKKEIEPSSWFYDSVKKRENHYPLEYILNSAGFYSMDFYVDERVLIPRPETEILIDKVLEISKNLKKSLKIAEIGTGSGIISVTLAKLMNDCEFLATDISKEALEVAKINAKKHKVEERIEFVHTNLLDGIEDDIDIIVSNPPYIKNGEELDRNLDYEPDLALFGGEEGDEILKKIIDLATKKDVKYLLCEMGYDQKDKIKNFCKKFDKEVKFYKDLAGFDRGFVLKL